MVTRRAPGALGIVYTYIDPLWFESLTRTLQIRRARLSDRTGRLACPSRMSSTKPRSHPRSHPLSASMVGPSKRPRVAISQATSTLRCRTSRPGCPIVDHLPRRSLTESRCPGKIVPSSSQPLTTTTSHEFPGHLDAHSRPVDPLARDDGMGVEQPFRDRGASCFCDMKVNTC